MSEDHLGLGLVDRCVAETPVPAKETLESTKAGCPLSLDGRSRDGALLAATDAVTAGLLVLLLLSGTWRSRV